MKWWQPPAGAYDPASWSSLPCAFRRAGAAPPADPLAALYGTGVGQIPLDLRPEDAVLDASGNVVSVPNRGGAGAAFNATVSGVGITISGGKFLVPATSVWLRLTNKANMVGVRLFLRAAVSVDPLPTTGTLNFAGTNDGTAVDGGRNNIRWDWGNNRFQVQRYNWDGTTGTTVSTLAPGPALTTAEILHEFEIAAGRLKVFRDTVQVADVACSVATFEVDRIFGGQSSPYFSGLSRGISSLIVDGVSDVSAQIAAIRASYGR